VSNSCYLRTGCESKFFRLEIPVLVELLVVCASVCDVGGLSEVSGLECVVK